MTEPIRRRPKTPFTLSPSSPVGPFQIVGGVIAEDSRRNFLGGDIAQQTERAMASLSTQLADLNAGLENIAAVTVYLKRAEDFAAMNEVYRGFWAVDPPTRTTIVAGLPHPEALIELTAVIIPRGLPREVIQPRSWKPSPNPYSYGIKSGRTLFLSGLVPRNPRDHSLIAGDIRVQTQALLDHAGELLHEAEMSFSDVISARIFLTDQANFEPMHAIYRRYFPVDPPASMVGITELMNPQFLVEITLMAVKSKYRLTMPPLPEHGPMQLSSFVQAEGRLFVSGMRGDAPETRHNPSAQALESLQRLTKLLKKARFSWRELREIVVYVTDMAHAPAVMYELAPFLPVYRRPAGIIVQTGLLAPGCLVEIAGTFARDRWRWR